MKSIDNHNADVKSIQNQLKNNNDEIVLQRTSTCCSRSFNYKNRKKQINISALNEILEVNTDKKYVMLEPLVTMESVVKFLKNYNHTLPVITEFKHMTIGGAIQGLGGESSAFRYGFIDDSVMEYEVLLSDGTLLIVDKNNNSDLFDALPGSFGSLAIITKIKLKLIPSKKYVLLTYNKLDNFSEVNEYFKNVLINDSNLDFIECVALGKNDFRLIKGEYKENISQKEKTIPKCSLKYFFSPWYLPHIIEKSNKSEYIEYMDYEDYVFRWDRGAFWMGLRFKHNLFNRIIFGSMLTCKNLYKYLYQIPLFRRDKEYLLQDFMLPTTEAENFFSYVDKKVNIYPIWLIPIKQPEKNKIFSLPSKSQLNCEGYIDFGVWGRPSVKYGDFVELNRDFEQYLREHNGKKWMWSQVYCTEREFWSFYDKQLYDEIRAKYKAKKLVNIYLKVTELYRSLINNKK